MPDFAKRSEMKAAIASIGRGELQQVRLIGDELERLDDRVEQLESSSQEPQAQPQPSEPQPQPSQMPDFSSVQPVKPVADDAKAVDVRDSVKDLGLKFNALLETLKNA